MRVLFLGMGGQFTQIVLERLLNAGVEVCALLLSGPQLHPLPTRNRLVSFFLVNINVKY